jgi:Ca2+-binding RTX toxin-like protein
MFGGAGNDTLQGGDGRDIISGGAGNDVTNANGGNDVLFGGAGDDTQYGGAGNDRIYANQGADTSYGGEGDDVLFARAPVDVHPGPNGQTDQVGDALDGGPGNDRFFTRDGEVDRITCGAGYDVAQLDTADVITDASQADPNGSCEKVVRRAPGRRNPGDPSGARDPREPKDR